MKIVILIYSLGGGGAERVAVTLANAWSACGHDICLVTMSGDRRDAYTASSAIRRVALGLEGQSSGIVEGIQANLSRIRTLRRLFRAEKPALILAMMAETNVAALLATRGLDIPVLVSERTHPPMYPLGRLWDTLRRWTYPWAHRVVMLTQDGLTWLRQEIPSAQGVVIPNPVTLPLPVALPQIAVDQYVAPQRRLVLAAGRMDEGKQFDRLIAAFAALQAEFPEWDLAILGEGLLRPQLQQQIDALQLTQRVCMPGRAGNIGHWYARAELYVLSSRFEGFPNVLAEAMAHGCAAISYDCDTGPRDIIRDGIDGLLVRPVGDIPALTAAMRALMGKPAERARMASCAKDAVERFSQAEILSIWNQVVERATVRP